VSADPSGGFPPVEQRVLPSFAAYADAVAGGDAGDWAAACRRASAVIEPHRAWRTNIYRDLWQMSLLESTALLIYALARSRGTTPDAITEGVLLAWLTAQPQPRSVEVARLLQAAGHAAPAPTNAKYAPWSEDQVTRVWQALQNPYDNYIHDELVHGPNINYGLDGLYEILRQSE
jgi:hypothetical protein